MTPGQGAVQSHVGRGRYLTTLGRGLCGCGKRWCWGPVCGGGLVYEGNKCTARGEWQGQQGGQEGEGEGGLCGWQLAGAGSTSIQATLPVAACEYAQAGCLPQAPGAFLCCAWRASVALHSLQQKLISEACMGPCAANAVAPVAALAMLVK